ncbi:contractile injection system protein, VgrG/Pvc8 family [Paenibacillus gorillae]|uniref:contractile injection system protein, VgrG/Pvc8 family n=1 Tax=Paenibacillus gorillae TaxID=1243662 RepID=UPI0004ADBBA6|nr:contractile injection system protein, VgrG/Pvc8 family [Paenibacillus gorillae]
MTQSVITYQNLKISPYGLVNLQQLSIKKKLNEHAYVKFTGIVPEEKKDSYIEMTGPNTQIEISQVDEEGALSPLFCGIVLSIEIKVIRGIYYMEVEGVSHSYKLDTKKKSRSFQNPNLTYPALLEKISKEYPGLEVMDAATNGGGIGKFTLQYQETDWQFLKRLASRMHTSLMPATVFDSPKFYFGVFESSAKAELDNYHYEVNKKMSEFRYFSEQEGADVEDRDFIFYEVETDKVLDLGHVVAFKGKQLYVREAVSEMTAGLLKHRYTLCSHRGLRHSVLYNELLIGASIQGEVISVTGDKVQVHLQIDKEQSKAEAHAFPYSSVYSAEGNSGWYCMPETGDHVLVYFPSNKEEEGVANGSVRQNSEDGGHNKLGNPDMKYFRTASGKELLMGPDEIVVTAKDGEIFIRISDKTGIEIQSSKPIKLTAAEDITMDAGRNLIISAKDEIYLNCKESEITLNGNTTIVGTELKTN